MKNIIKVACLATLAFFALTAEGCPAEGNKANEASRTIVFQKNGGYTITKARAIKIRNINPKPGCEWYIVNDVPGKNVAIKLKSGDANDATANLGATYTVKNEKTGKRYRLKGTSFYTKDCGTWVKN